MIKKKRKRTKAAVRSRKWRKKYPEKAKRCNRLRRKRQDTRDRTIWHKKLRVLRLHCGELFSRFKHKNYEGIEVRLSVVEIAKVWFRDRAQFMRNPELDRVDPDGHYEFENVRYIEKEENYARRRPREVAPF